MKYYAFSRLARIDYLILGLLIAAMVFVAGCWEPLYFHLSPSHPEIDVDSVWTACEGSTPQLVVRFQVQGYGPDAVYEDIGEGSFSNIYVLERGSDEENRYELKILVAVERGANPDSRSYTYVWRQRIVQEGYGITSWRPGMEIALEALHVQPNGTNRYEVFLLQIPAC